MENLAETVRDYILQLEAQVAALQEENAGLRNEIEAMNTEYPPFD